MGKCTCSLYAGSMLGTAPPSIPIEEIPLLNWPLRCTECEKEVDSPEKAGLIGDFSYPACPDLGIQAVCTTCFEISKCFFCTCAMGELWPTLRKKYNTIGLGNLTELVSPETKAVLIEKVDQWFLEDEEEDEAWDAAY